MRVPLEWLKELVPIRLAPEALARRLTLSGTEVVGILDVDGQPVLDLEVTPNRPDCLSILGIAREVAALTGQRLKLSVVQGSGLGVQGQARKPRTPNPEPRTKLTIQIEDRKGCPRYIGRLLTGVRIGPSPEWMQRRLLACGTRPINVIVDITNYVLFEYGHPLHAFDFARLAQGLIRVRRARSGETMTTLDGQRRTLSPEMLVIADAQDPVAVAGVMGGQGSEVHPDTTAVLLECALFEPTTVRRTARKLGLMTESSYRFERGVDPGGVEAASARAAALIQSLADGQEAVVRDVGTEPPKRAAILLDTERVTRWLGVSLSPTLITGTLAKLSCRVASSGARGVLRVSVPSWRGDLVQDVDLIEELARVVGYDTLPSTLPVASLQAGPASPESVATGSTLRRTCAGLGLVEAMSWALLSEADLARSGHATTEALRLTNPISQDHAYLRPSLLAGLLQAVQRNLHQGLDGVRLFELGRVFEPAPPRETLRLGLALAGSWWRDWRSQEPAEFPRLKGLLEVLLSSSSRSHLVMTAMSLPWAEPGSSARIQVGGRDVGVAGQVARRVTNELSLEPAVWYAELSADVLLARGPAAGRVEPPPTFPPVKRDVSIVVKQDVAYASVDRAIREVAGSHAVRVELIDRYTGQQVPAGHVSLTFSLEYRDPQRTLTAGEADALHHRVTQALADRFGARLR